ncbi:hypothetical protein N7510_000655 [Penicillium lagena]|uniref:uncharacterized protein n=1 Tax=Penicillium lagena TaxID=94218 RepID=UPI0025405F53|nr:uncharacterized protein N7510_000655 [Penicillium lagena]KAJ5624346.1 hypothetical protein N7510_000655 [Penicillium lagena]
MLTSRSLRDLMVRVFCEEHLTSLGLAFIILPVIYVFYNEFLRFSARVPGIGGPKGLPIVGNLWAIRKNAAEQYRLWAEKHGPVYQVSLGNIPIIVVNSAEAAKGIFGLNAQALSSRPEFYTFHKRLTGLATTIGTASYSDSLKKRRKVAAATLNRPGTAKYVWLLDIEIKQVMADLLEDGKAGAIAIDPMTIIQRLSLSVTTCINWGVRIPTRNAFFDEIIHIEERISSFRSTTGNLQDYVPLLRWNPFDGSAARTRDTRRRQDLYLNHLNRELADRMEKGTQMSCIQKSIITDEGKHLNQEEKSSVDLTMISGGLDTFPTTVVWLIALLAKRPDIQERAFSEIRNMYPEDQPLCHPEDDQKCVYVAALIRETLRMYSVLRLNLPRVSIRDITYDGVTYPKGTTFFINSYACNMDEKIWPDAHIFRPERWIEQPDAPMFTYGIGYRMCAGFMLANRELYLLFMRIISCFKIQVDEDIDIHPVTGTANPKKLVSQPHRYRAKFVPRDANVLRYALDNFVPTEPDANF